MPMVWQSNLIDTLEDRAGLAQTHVEVVVVPKGIQREAERALTAP